MTIKTIAILIFCVGSICILGYFYVIPIIRCFNCKLGDTYYKELKETKNPFETPHRVSETYVIKGIKNGYVKYDKHEKFDIDGNGKLSTLSFTRSMKKIPFFMYIVYDFKKITK